MLTRKKQISEAFNTPHAVASAATFGHSEAPRYQEKVVDATFKEIKKVVAEIVVIDKFGKKFDANQYFINPETGRANKIK